MKKLASPKVRELRAKLYALVDRGINGERDAAKVKLKRLEGRYDFTAPNDGGTSIFAGVFVRAFEAAPVMRFESGDWDIANSVKWAIQKETGVACLYRGSELMAQAEPESANRLHDMAATIAGAMAALWGQFRAAPGVNPADRANFIAGLADGMLEEIRTGEQLPQRAAVEKVKRAKKQAVAMPAGLSVHPYTVAVSLGRQIRFSVPIVEIAGQLEHRMKTLNDAPPK